MAKAEPVEQPVTSADLDDLKATMLAEMTKLLTSNTSVPNPPAFGDEAGESGRRRRTAGDDADPIVQRSFRLRKSLALRFKAKAARNGLSLQEALNALMLAYLANDRIIDGIDAELTENA